MGDRKPSPTAAKPGFTVTDRRASGDEPAGPPSPPGTASAEAGAIPPVDFATFVLSLGSSALFHMGELDEPEAGTPPKLDLGLAKHTIDVLAMLQEKTKGNLTGPEATLVENLLFDLRLRFVDAQGGSR